MKKLLLLPLILSSLNSDFLRLNLEEKKHIKSLPNKKIIAKRFSNFYKFLNKARTFELDEKLLKTNLHLNKIIPRIERTNNWSSPKEFLINGYGDCEDYVLAKYFSLLNLGLNKKNLFMSVVKVKGSSGYHMVLLYNNINEILVLDNLSWKVIPFKNRKDLTFNFAFNESGSYTFNDKFELIKEKEQKRAEVKVFKEFLKGN